MSPTMKTLRAHLRTVASIGIGVSIGLLAFVTLSYVRIHFENNGNAVTANLVYVLLVPTVIAFVVLLNKKINHLNLRQWGLIGRHPLRRLFVGSILGFVASIVITITAASVFHTVEIHFDPNMRRSGLELINPVLFVMTTAIWEEHLFRGFVQVTLLRRGFGVVTAVVVSALVFTLPHAFWGNPDAHPVSLLAIFSLGVLMGYGYAATGSIWLAVGLHFSWNIAIELIQYQDIGLVSIPNYPEIRGQLELVEVAFLLVIAAAYTVWLVRSGRTRSVLLSGWQSPAKSSAHDDFVVNSRS